MSDLAEKIFDMLVNTRRQPESARELVVSHIRGILDAELPMTREQLAKEMAEAIYNATDCTSSHPPRYIDPEDDRVMISFDYYAGSVGEVLMLNIEPVILARLTAYEQQRDVELAVYLVERIPAVRDMVKELDDHAFEWSLSNDLVDGAADRFKMAAVDCVRKVLSDFRAAEIKKSGGSDAEQK